MSDEAVTNQSQILLYQTEDGRQRIEVRLDKGTVWLSQALMAELFQTTVSNVNIHIRNIYETGELVPKPTIKEHLIVQQEGTRKVQRTIAFYPLDARKLGPEEGLAKIRE